MKQNSLLGGTNIFFDDDLFENNRKIIREEQWKNNASKVTIGYMNEHGTQKVKR